MLYVYLLKNKLLLHWSFELREIVNYAPVKWTYIHPTKHVRVYLTFSGDKSVVRCSYFISMMRFVTCKRHRRRHIFYRHRCKTLFIINNFFIYKLHLGRFNHTGKGLKRSLRCRYRVYIVPTIQMISLFTISVVLHISHVIVTLTRK